jgi:hypothetical protein
MKLISIALLICLSTVALGKLRIYTPLALRDQIRDGVSIFYKLGY